MIPRLVSIDSQVKQWIVVILLLTVAVLLIIPTALRYHRLASEVGQLRAKVRDAEQDVAHLEKLRRVLDELSTKSASVESSLLTADQSTSELLERLSSTAEQVGLKLVGITPQSPVVSVGPVAYREIPIAVSAKSGYHELGTFLGRLEGLPERWRISGLKITGDRADPLHHDIQLVISSVVMEPARP